MRRMVRVRPRSVFQELFASWSKAIEGRSLEFVSRRVSRLLLLLPTSCMLCRWVSAVLIDRFC